LIDFCVKHEHTIGLLRCKHGNITQPSARARTHTHLESLVVLNVGLENDIGVDGRALDIVGDGHARGLGHGRVLAQRTFQLRRANAVTGHLCVRWLH
jgi:hypothetical protein